MEGSIARSNLNAVVDSRDAQFDEEALTVHSGLGAGPVVRDVHVDRGTLLVAGRDVNFHVHHHHPSEAQCEVREVPSFLSHVPNFRDIHMAILGKATSGTGVWIYEWNEFCIWKGKDGLIRMLWGSGMPGAGKTILASLAINHMEVRAANGVEDSPTPICVGYLYIRYSDSAKITLRDLLEVLVRQTVERHETMLPLCKEVYARHVREQTEPSAQELFGLLKQFTSELTTFYFLDALDEAPDQVQRELLEYLTSLNAKLFITSRPLKSFENRFPDAHHFQIVAQDHDLETHIVQEISRSTDLQAILATATPGLEGRITLTVKRQCNGMFLHASLHLQALRECTSRYDLEKALNDFPPQISDVYAETWNRIINQPPGRATLAMGVLPWLAYAARSLTIEELLYAVAVDTDTHKFERTRRVPLETLVGACCGLLIIESETKVARLVHYTAAVALQNLIAKINPHPHTLLAAVCMGRLTEAKFQNSSIDSKEDLDATLKATPFLAYAYWAWFHHARESLDDNDSKSRVSSFLQACLAFPIFPYKYGTFDRFGPLHVAAYFHLPSSLLPSTFLRDPNLPSREEGLSPLHLASVRNSAGAAKELLGHSNILVNARSKHGHTALRLASRFGAEDVLKLLLSHPHNQVNQATKEGLTALHSAARSGNTGAVKLLLEDSNVKVNVADTSGTTPLMLASASGNPETVRVLVAHPQVNVNLADKKRNTALILAVLYARDPDVVKALLAHPQIDVDQRDGGGKPAFYYARKQRWNGSRDVVDALLGAYRQGPTTSTASQHASHGAGPSSIEWIKDLALSLVRR